ncbi:hypothetical protein FQR65_LT20306 [Abscondita terminalis]|nr:hypothetical protein FQR65_LT20306 [Abscondita terminalis]
MSISRPQPTQTDKAAPGTQHTPRAPPRQHTGQTAKGRAETSTPASSGLKRNRATAGGDQLYAGQGQRGEGAASTAGQERPHREKSQIQKRFRADSSGGGKTNAPAR